MSDSDAGISRTWGTDAAERRLPFPCDAWLEAFDLALFRGITIRSSPAVLFRWLCQLRVAPYSYDWIDNYGRRSPRELTPGIEKLEVGQTVMTIFELVEFETDRHLTMRSRPGTRAERLFGRGAVSYLIVPQAVERCRLLVKILIATSPATLAWPVRWLLPWGDLVMMRRQLLNFKRLAERMSRGG
ncbi:MAG: hypothetical protein V3R89_06530 [Thermoanaerobaculia bacterium]